MAEIELEMPPKAEKAVRASKNIALAAVHIEDALRGRVTEPESVAIYWFFYGRLWQIIYFTTAVVHNG